MMKLLLSLLIGLGLHGAAAAAPPQEAEQQGEKVYTPKEVTRRAVIKERPEPEYTVEAERQGFDGQIEVRLVLSSSGRVTHAKAVNELPYGLTEEAIKAARKIKFKPAIKDGRPVSVYAKIVYVFKRR